jgi:DNA-binding transcriptional regulator YdaS (Cro superfamily)
MEKKTFKDVIIKKKDAIAAAGNAAELARLLGISRASISEWGDEVPRLQAFRLKQVFPKLGDFK